MAVLATLDNTWGAAFVGMILGAILYGMTCIQTFFYFMTFPDDAWPFKALAAAAIILDSVSLGLTTSAMYGYFVTDMGNPENRLIFRKGLAIEPVIMGTINVLTHGYLGVRVWKITKRNHAVGVFLGSASVAVFALPFSSAIALWRAGTWPAMKSNGSLSGSVLANNVINLVIETFIAITMLIALARHDVEGKSGRGLIRKVSILAINTGFLLSVVSLMFMVTYLAFPQTMLFMAFTMVYTKVYANVLLANLNAREHLRDFAMGERTMKSLSFNLSSFRIDGAERNLTRTRLNEGLNGAAGASLQVQVQIQHERSVRSVRSGHSYTPSSTSEVKMTRTVARLDTF
ncbi:hypothetical protein D9611_008421 [Ephemerocybe angulata]|uniref:DUF6534 domain-containing protein n=1 Tax=Ephemerocybe angulata TaxID=980116 RepID=A0A8H5F561_9AGAR|nr:hypothetical protein D9611_008421 [Tulosesus angulatus]